MGEPVVWNKKLLVTALLLGIVAMVLFFAYDWMQKTRVEENVIRVLRWKADLKVGQEVSEADFGPVEVSRDAQRNLNLMEYTPSNRTFPVGNHLSRDVKRDDFMRFSDLLENPSEVPSRRIKYEEDDDGNPRVKGYRAFPLEVDPRRTVGDLLRVDDRIDIIGLISIGGKPARAYSLIKNLRVLAVGGRSQSPEARFRQRGRERSSQNLRVYRTLTVEVQEKTACNLAELLPRVRGKIWIVVRHPEEGESMATDGKINPALRPVLDEPLPDDADFD